ncbi:MULTISPECIES: replication initiation protein [Yersiniaceae]|uniref:Replication initiation protein n=1 Tax=Yersinia intermedia TaxID=631 RepID=A0A0T9N0I1_YERIN|nr:MULTISPECIES: replication initiation protein [Yersiniaceae]EKN4845639.1 replication initiation protein [Yersinia enterocolitica]CNL09601.1 Replication initiation protein [Yersinia frederiksenii]BBT46518.1 RepB family plasmid replication initiator protein [Enterobacter cloacae]EKN5065581.1 RepB family plasmid replication initiator protein [Yersinia enterocolitica]MBI0194776.1 replication initiation protein [Yersinia pestis subsp. pestis]
MRIKTVKRLSEKTKIRHRNEINKTLAQLPLSAKRVLCLALVSVDTKKPLEPGKIFKVTADTYSSITKVKPSVAYRQLKEGAELLNNSKLSLSSDDIAALAKELGLPDSMKKSFERLDMGITDYCAYSQNEGFVVLKFTNTIHPYISNLIGGENKFTTQLLTSAMRLSGQYSWALYQLVRKNYSKFKAKNYFTIHLNELKDELIAYSINDDGNIEYKYPDFPIFKREVINKAIKEINEKTEIELLSCLVESKDGRKVSVLRFEFLIDEDKFTGDYSEDEAAFLEEFDKKVPPNKK